jgi:hypothetical protein
MKRLILLALCTWPLVAGAQSAPDLATFNAKTAPLVALVQQAKIIEDCNLRPGEWFVAISIAFVYESGGIANAIWGNTDATFIASLSATKEFEQKFSDAVTKGEDIAARQCDPSTDEIDLAKLDQIANKQGYTDPTPLQGGDNNSAIFTADMQPWLSALYKARVAKDCGFRDSDWYNSVDKFLLSQAHIVVGNLWDGDPTPYPAAEYQFAKEMGQNEGAADDAVPAACANGMDATAVNRLDALVNQQGGRS